MNLKVGDIAPPFTLPDDQGNLIRLSDFLGQQVVLYFYPRDHTPGCTQEACGFRDQYSDYQTKSVVILGISLDDEKSHTKFRNKHQLPFTLLSDKDAQVSQAYGCYGLKKFMGKEFMGIIRRTFLIDAEGHIQKIYCKVKPATHATEILADLSNT